MSFEEFQNGNGMILAILNLCVTAMPPINFQLNLTSSLGGDVVWRISRWPPSWILKWNNFSNLESPCCHNVSHWVSVQSNLWFWRKCQKCEKLTKDDGRTDNGWTDGRRTTDQSISWLEQSSRWAINSQYQPRSCIFFFFQISPPISSYSF